MNFLKQFTKNSIFFSKIESISQHSKLDQIVSKGSQSVDCKITKPKNKENLLLEMKWRLDVKINLILTPLKASWKAQATKLTNKKVKGNSITS